MLQKIWEFLCWLGRGTAIFLSGMWDMVVDLLETIEPSPRRVVTIKYY